MNEWQIAALVMAVALVPCIGVCLFAGVAHGLAAFEVASTVLTCTLMVLCEGTRRQPFLDLAVVFAVLSIVGALVFARLMESDL